MDIRLNLIKKWLTSDLGLTLRSIKPASADASFRRYFRVTTDKSTWIVMDAPPEKESIREFIDIAQQLANQGVHTPLIKAQNIEQGLLLLEDLGNRTYLDELKSQSEHLYSDAISALIKIQNPSKENHSGTAISTPEVPIYSAAKLEQEMDLFEHWYIEKHLSLSLNSQMKSAWHDLKKHLINACLEQPQVIVHRDYHSRNLMICDTNSPGVIDFQDMVIGPITYDLASLFKDCYIEWPREQQLVWLEQYRQLANQKLDTPLEQTQLIQWYDLTGLQRHLKVLGIFCRLHYRDGKDQYLDDLPLVARYVSQVLDLYPQFKAFKESFTLIFDAK